MCRGTGQWWGWQLGEEGVGTDVQDEPEGRLRRVDDVADGAASLAGALLIGRDRAGIAPLVPVMIEYLARDERRDIGIGGGGLRREPALGRGSESAPDEKARSLGVGGRLPWCWVGATKWASTPPK